MPLASTDRPATREGPGHEAGRKLVLVTGVTDGIVTRRIVLTITTSSESMIAHAADVIDLAAWLATLSDRDYQACSPGHRAGGTFHEGGTLGSINVESVGGHLLIQHYLAATSAPSHLVMHSRNTRVYVLHVFPATIEVIWTLEVEPVNGVSALFRCSVEARIPMPLSIFATLALLPFFLRRHVAGETPLFARDLARKLSGGRADARSFPGATS